MRIVQVIGDARPHYHAALQYTSDTPDRPAPFFWPYQPGLVIGVWSCVIAMLPSSLQSPDLVLVVFGIRDHQLALFLGTHFHGSLLSLGRKKIEQNWFVNVDEGL